MEKLEKISQKIIEYSFYTLFILTPLILTPWSYELFEFNKMITVYLLTTIIVGAWLIKMVTSRRFVFQRSFWDIPLLLFLFSQFLSFWFSVDRHTSFWGYYSRFNGGLLSIICYSLLYWAFVSNINKTQTKQLLKIILATGFIVAGYGIAQHFGVDAHLWVQDVKSRVFSTLGQPNWLAAWLAALIPLTWGLALNPKFQTLNSKRFEHLEIRISNLFKTSSLGFRIFICYLLFTIYYLCLLFTRSRSGFLGFLAAFLVFWGAIFWLQRKNWRPIKKSFLIFTFLFLLLTFITDYSWIPLINKLKFAPSISKNKQTESQTKTPAASLLISESGDIRKVVWRGAIEIWRHYPVFGTGPETFAYTYYWYRPREHNDLSEWDFLYNKAHNEYLNYAATTGTIGLISYLILIGSFLFWSIKNIKYKISNIKNTNKNSKIEISATCCLLFAFFSGFVSILVSNFFGFSVVPIQLIFFLFPAFAVTFFYESKQNYKIKSPITTPQLLIIFFLIFAICYLTFNIVKYWRADAYFAQGEKLNKAGQYDLAFNSLQQAIKLRSKEPIYHDELAWSAANLAVIANQQKDSSLSTKFIQIALEESEQSLKTSPYHLNFWKTKAKIAWRLAEINPEYYKLALESLTYASKLAPTDPKIKYNLGLAYLALGENDQAIATLEEAVTLKPNYEDPRWALSLLYEQRGEIQKAREHLEYILKNINPLSQKAKEKLNALK